MASRPRFSHVCLLVDDFPACFRFYRDTMGFDPVWGDETDSYAEFVAGGSDTAGATGSEDTDLTLFDRAEMADVLGTADRPGTRAERDTAMAVFDVDDLDAEAATLRERGASFAVDPTDRPDWGVRVAYLRDPDGSLLELSESIPTDGAEDETA